MNRRRSPRADIHGTIESEGGCLMGQTRHTTTRRRKSARVEAEENLSMWVGWVAFAGIVMGTTGLLNLLQGAVALFNEGYYTAAGDVVAIDYTTWGVILLATGLILCFTGYGVLTGRTWARIVGVVIASIDAVINFAFIGAFPIWSILAVSLNLIAIYAISVHGREAQILR
jgi:hypothetical protein